MTRVRKRDNSEAMRRRRRRLIENGLCVLCGQNKATTGKQGGTTLCDPCRAKQHRWTTESARKRAARKKGLCDVCLTRPAVAGPGSGTRCEACRKQLRTRR